MRTPSSLFWKFFFAIWLGYVLIIGISTVLLETEYKARYSEIELGDRYQPLADYIISNYEQGIDITRQELRQNRGQLTDGEGFNQNNRNDEMAIIDLDEDIVIFGDRAWLNRDNRVSWIERAPNGNYMVNVGIPPLLSALPDLASPAAIVGAFATSILYSWLFTLFLTRPISRLKRHVERLGRGGNLDQKLESKLMSRRDEIGDLAGSIDEMSGYIQELLNSKQRLLFDVSHELRAPLARMQVAAEIVRIEADKMGSDTSMHDRFEREIESLNALISELLLLAKTESESKELPLISLSDELAQIVEDMRFGAGDRVINQAFNLKDSSAKAEVKISAPMIDRVVKNLIENAIKYSDGEICIRLDEEQEYWLIRVEDQGEGIPDDQLETMMQPFTRLQSESVEGFGLGLSIAVRAVQAVGGSMALMNRESGGLCAAVRLPRNN